MEGLKEAMKAFQVGLKEQLRLFQESIKDDIMVLQEGLGLISKQEVPPIVIAHSTFEGYKVQDHEIDDLLPYNSDIPTGGNECWISAKWWR